MCLSEGVYRKCEKITNKCPREIIAENREGNMSNNLEQFFHLQPFRGPLCLLHPRVKKITCYAKLPVRLCILTQSPTIAQSQI